LRSLQDIQSDNGRRLWRRPRPKLGCGAKERERERENLQENYIESILKLGVAHVVKKFSIFL
jgi:hypothetical protein